MSKEQVKGFMLKQKKTIRGNKELLQVTSLCKLCSLRLEEGNILELL